MSILVVGSVAYDNLDTPHGKRDDVLGGAATHFSTAASFFTPVHVVGVVGSDFDNAHLEFLMSKGIDVSGIKVVEGGKTFRWTGKYFDDINHRETLDTQLGVFATFDPELSEQHAEEPFLFLANIHPSLQLKVLDQMKEPKLVAMDTMNLWIDTTREDLQKVIERVDMMFINDEEARMLTGDLNVSVAAKKIMSWGPKVLVIKRGEYGALLYTEDSVFAAPGLPLSDVVDPTGAGDTFAGGFLGYVAKTGDISKATLRRAVICGSVMASFQVEDFGLDRLRELTTQEIDKRFGIFKELAHFEAAPLF
ncbi:MAG: sugar kinase [Deltaproteobacteria bacterium]|jgi:sugar/nucleoside kinase (ribokinase family)|nr:sugar kinase [Deltaproteobacteria bacterium]